MKKCIKGLGYIPEYESSMEQLFRKDFSWMRNVTAEHHYFSYHGSLTTPNHLLNASFRFTLLNWS